jgi:hypothetical protein
MCKAFRATLEGERKRPTRRMGISLPAALLSPVAAALGRPRSPVALRVTLPGRWS